LVGVGVTLLAVILGAVAYFSEEFARRREQRRQAETAEDAKRAEEQRFQLAKRAEEQRLQLAADHVFCDIRPAADMPVEPRTVEVDGREIAVDMPIGPRRAGLQEVEITVDNRSGSVVTDLGCILFLRGSGWSIPSVGPINNGEVVRPKFPKSPRSEPLLTPPEVHWADIRANTYFTFSLNGHQWSRQCGRSALRLSELV
jgi:hypothetical protein